MEKAKIDLSSVKSSIKDAASKAKTAAEEMDVYNSIFEKMLLKASLEISKQTKQTN